MLDKDNDSVSLQVPGICNFRLHDLSRAASPAPSNRPIAAASFADSSRHCTRELSQPWSFSPFAFPPIPLHDMEAMKPVLDMLDAIIKDVEQALTPLKTETEALKSTDRSAVVAGDASVQPQQQKKKKKEKKPKQPPPPVVDPVISQFLQCDLRVGRVIDVSFHPEADGLYVLKVSYGGDEVKTVCAGLRKFIPEEEMKDRMVVTICNLKPRKLRGVASEAMILAGSVVSGEGEKETVVPIAPPSGAQMGSIVSAEGIEGERTVTEGKNVSGKVWDKVVPRLGVKGEIACYDGKHLTTGAGVIACALPDGAAIH